MFTSQNYRPASPPGAGRPIVAPAPVGPTTANPAAPASPALPATRSARLRTLSVLRSVTHRVTAASSSSHDASAGSGGSPAQTPPSPSHHSRFNWSHSPLTRSLSHNPAGAAAAAAAASSSSAASPGARDAVSDESIARTRSLAHGPADGHRLELGPGAAPWTTSDELTPRRQVHDSATDPPPTEDNNPTPQPLQPQSPPQPQQQQPPSQPNSNIPTPSSSPEIQIPATSGTMEAGTSSASAPRAAPPHPPNPASTLPSIRFAAYVDPRAQRPSLTFATTTRILPTGSEVIRVGRYSERDGHGAAAAAVAAGTGSDRVPSAAPVGFKSKVVSRRHCEFWFESGKWYIKDVKSSSGTFLNHIRLSPPGTESKPYVVKDGDVVQLGIDFKGGEEMIFRCVKIRLELNRGWASKPSNFNLASHKRLRNLVSQGSSNSQDCSICLNSIAPCQSLFVAPCSHTWHYKCIRSLLNTSQYPYFQCPNCRTSADLEAEVEQPEEEWEALSDVQEAPDGGEKADVDSGAKVDADADADAQVDGTVKGKGPSAVGPNTIIGLPEAHPANPSPSPPEPADPPSPPSPLVIDADDAPSPHAQLPTSDSPPPPDGPPHDPPHGLPDGPSSGPYEWPRSGPITVSRTPGAPGTAASVGFHRPAQRTPSPSSNPGVHGADGPITPRNDAGPWVFDGSAGRRSLVLGLHGLVRDEAPSGSIDGVIDTDDER